MSQERLFQEGTGVPDSWETYLLAQLHIKTNPEPLPPWEKNSTDPRGPRLFTAKVKQQCWDRSGTVYGRDPQRWRIDALGNPVIHGLKGCMGKYCHEYDHILPYSKGGHSIVQNCQVLQTTVNRGKGNKTDCTFAELRAMNPVKQFDEAEMSLVEQLLYGDIRKG